MSAMTYSLNQMHERAAATEGLFAVTITNENGKRVPTVIIVTDTLNAEQQEKAREHLWAIAEILRNNRRSEVETGNCPGCGSSLADRQKYKGEDESVSLDLMTCPHCGTQKCCMCDMGDDVVCISCESDDGG